LAANRVPCHVDRHHDSAIEESKHGAKDREVPRHHKVQRVVNAVDLEQAAVFEVPQDLEPTEHAFERLALAAAA